MTLTPCLFLVNYCYVIQKGNDLACLAVAALKQFHDVRSIDGTSGESKYGEKYRSLGCNR
jgi:hypothetical protein